MKEHLHAGLLEAAEDIGRLRRQAPADSSLEHLAIRLANGVESMLLMIEPTAAQLVATTAPGDEAAVDEALRIVDARSRVLRHTLGHGE